MFRMPRGFDLQALDAMKRTQEKYQNKEVKLHPNSCTPIIFTLKHSSLEIKRRKVESCKVTEYEAEVAVPAGRIAPEALIFLNKQQT